MKRTAIYPGSFDPATFGHLDIIRRASGLFDTLIVSVLVNRGKKPLFSAEKRVELLSRIVSDIPNVEIEVFSGLLVDYAEQKGASVIVKGLRAVSDFEYELQMALANKKLRPNIDTVFLTASLENMYLSSSIVKDVAGHGGDISGFVPGEILKDVLFGINGAYLE